ncbi:hypothetical protein TVAG_223970 [Trichomonas vaginalis G3]|uniref:Nucleoporin Nup54 alpha-helical domain-containing protein n=1 Tax=Trichomonas vaginalis (strain ATCC PRA-98 / G3) TaxID=412133 RepID=A2DW20_TRIV3|nr:nucleoporin P54 family [Trichomonas vaginalis G3]EAY15321.1 hypothetical protein TVAG_223970 [Trichomonas vaginalis G3]KAI5496816.1 nucleoporin P54 family [Trichomonas vaginalis G3]|eukprot:XP_001327544.1 hypothetical protein [Trichomonas vaginalis G3]
MLSRGLGQKTTTKASDPFVQRLNLIISAYDENSEDYRFAHILYNSQKDTKQSKGLFGGKSTSLGGGGGLGGGLGKNKPKCISEREFSSYQDLAPKGFEPTVLKKDDIPNRMKAQKEILEQMKTKLHHMSEKIANINKDIEFFKKTDLAEAASNNRKILDLSMQQLSKKEVGALKSIQFSREEQELLDKLEAIKAQLNEPNKFVSQLNKLSLLQKFMEDSQEDQEDEFKIPEKRLKDVQDVLEVNGKSLAALEESIKIYQTFVKVQQKLLDQQRQNSK